MVSYFPNPYPDELLYSTISRFNLHVRNKRIYTFEDLFGVKGMTMSIDLPSRINDLVESIPENPDLTAKNFITMHTLFPFYTAFIGNKRRQKAYNLMLNRGKSLRYLLGLTAKSVCPRNTLHYCPQCLIDDLNIFGEPFWHVTHQVPGVYKCYKHKVKLLDRCLICENAIHTYKEHGLIALTERCSNGHDLRYINLENEVDSDRTQMFDYYVEDVNHLIKRGLAFDPYRISNVYNVALNKRGYLKGNYMLKIANICCDFCNFYGEEFLANMNCNKKTDWIHTILYTPNIAVHPLKHILFIRFLFGSFDKFVDFYNENKEMVNTGRKSKIYREVNIKSGHLIEEKKRIIRENILLEISKEPRPYTRSEVKNRAPKEYLWLQRHDREWLEGKLPQSHMHSKVGIRHLYFKIQWDQEDHKYFNLVNDIVINLQETKGKPSKLTARKIIEELGMNNGFWKKLQHMPLTKSKIESVCETTEEFHLRSLYWAVEQLKKSGTKITKSKIKKLAGIGWYASEIVKKAIMEHLEKS